MYNVQCINHSLIPYTIGTKNCAKTSRSGWTKSFTRQLRASHGVLHNIGNWLYSTNPSKGLQKKSEKLVLPWKVGKKKALNWKSVYKILIIYTYMYGWGQMDFAPPSMKLPSRVSKNLPWPKVCPYPHLRAKNA